MDPRYVVTSPNEQLTLELDNELADLEKEYAVKRQKLLERKKRRAKEATSGPTKSPQEVPEKAAANLASGPTVLARESSGQESGQRDSKPTPLRVDSRHGPLLQSGHETNYKTSFKAHQTKTRSTFGDRLSVVAPPATPIYEFENVPKRTPTETTEKDTFSGETLSLRYLPGAAVETYLKHVKVLRAPKLLAKVHPPAYSPPEYANWVFCGVVLHKSGAQVSANGLKYMTARIGLFDHGVDVAFFGDAFKRYWTLVEGDIVAVLNPEVKKRHGGFSLVVPQGLACVLEVGRAAHFAHCQATAKSTGERCRNVVDRLKNGWCAHHEEERFRGGRMELQGAAAPLMRAKKDTTWSYDQGTVYGGGRQFSSAYDRPLKKARKPARANGANLALSRQLQQLAGPATLRRLEQLGVVPSTPAPVREAPKIAKAAPNSAARHSLGPAPEEIARVARRRRAAMALLRQDNLDSDLEII